MPKSIALSQPIDFTDKVPENESLQQKLCILLPGTFLREYMGWTSEQLEALRGRQWEELPGE